SASSSATAADDCTDDEPNHDRADERDDDGSDEAPRVTEVELLAEPPADDPAQHTDEDVGQASARGRRRHDEPGQPARDQAHDDPAEKTHVEHHGQPPKPSTADRLPERYTSRPTAGRARRNA